MFDANENLKNDLVWNVSDFAPNLNINLSRNVTNVIGN